MKLNCPVCGSAIQVDSRAYRNYFGSLRCSKCRRVLQVAIKEGELRFIMPG